MKNLRYSWPKRTGKWTGINALDFGIPLTLITESVFARCVSSFKDQRVAANQLFGKTIQPVEGDKKVWIEAVRKALLASKNYFLCTRLYADS